MHSTLHHLLLLASVFFWNCGARIVPTDPESLWSTKYTLCGPTLNRALENHCKGQFNKPQQITSDVSGTKQGGITNECCTEPCDIKVLDSYCHESQLPKLGSRSGERVNEILRGSERSKLDNSLSSNRLRSASNLKINDSMSPSFQVGTIPPDHYGGSPVVIPPRHRLSNRHRN